MGHTWANSSWQRMEAIGRQEMAYSKLARARSNYYKDRDYGGTIEMDNLPIGIKCALDYCCENSPYDIHKGYHSSHDYSDQSCGREVNHEGLIGENDYAQHGEGIEDGLYCSYNIISFPLPPSYSCFGHFCKETKSCTFVLDLDRNSIQYACTIISLCGRRHTMEFEDKGENVGGKLFLCYGDSSISFSSNLFLFYLVFSFKELKLFLDGYDFLEFILSMRYEPWNTSDSLGVTNHCTFSFLENNFYDFYDHCVKFQGEVVEHLKYVLTSLDPYVMDFDERNLLVKGLSFSL
ncbi:hypothetical protein M9H77_09461 [Catharanthus roseus]|uniref:Uncharacterized protein n=1 Tax=Catharanthus roseus TaxID=4058 RepID=A0ACC0C0Q9_CATRO|nr:hypothetical protein M9H77_09461 [Catharanthus roseus]